MDNGGSDVITFSKFCKRLILDNLNNHDCVIMIDGSASSRHGPVGIGKTAVEMQLMVSLNPTATLVNNMVIKDDLEQYQRLLASKKKFVVIGVDECEWFFYKRKSLYGDQVDRVMEMMSNRKFAKYHVLTGPRIWDLDKVMLYDRVKWRLRIERRGVVSLHVRNNPTKWNQKADLWGAHVCTFPEVPMPPDYLWREYQRCVDTYEPAVWDGTGRHARVLTPAVRAKEYPNIEHALSSGRYTNSADRTVESAVYMEEIL